MRVQLHYAYRNVLCLTSGKNFIVFCGVIQHLNLVSTSIGYTVTSGIAMAYACVSKVSNFHQPQLYS